MPSLPVVFVGSSALGLPVARRVAGLLESVARPLVWDRIFGPTGGTFHDLTRIISGVDAAVMVLTPDDRLAQLREGAWSAEAPSPRDNVVFEVGLWIGALGRERVVFLEPTQPKLVKPTDLAGVTAVAYPGDDAAERWTMAERSLREWLCGVTFQEDTRPIVAWPTPTPEGSRLLKSSRGEARHGLLLVGNTMAQVQASDQSDPARWLADDPQRRIGVLFLNPHGPHAQGRDRPHLHRGAREAGLVAYRQALLQPIHPRCVPLIYDGPYRYSLRGIDVAPGTRNAVSEVHVTHSTHQRGITGGFSIALPFHRGAKAFASLAADALGLWKSAYANPPGHGLTLAVGWEPEAGPSPHEMESSLASAVRALLHDRAQEIGEVHLNGVSQWHMTLASLRRTGPRWGGPLSTSAATPDEALPPGFAEYLMESCERLRSGLRSANLGAIAVRVTHLKLTRSGHLIAFDPGPVGQLPEVVNEFLASRADALRTLGFDASAGGPFVPKRLDFWPHVSVGMAFHNAAALPEPLSFEGEEPVVRLEKPMAWTSSRFQAVHYAYRSFRRLVGSFSVMLGRGSVERHELSRSLGIG